MAGNRQAIQSRIRSVKSTKKITKAMQMIANAKLAKSRKKMESNRFYAGELQKLVTEILHSEEPFESRFLREHTMFTDLEMHIELIRYTCAMPAQALAYKWGSRFFANLRARAERELGEAFDIKRYHEAVLAYGATPLDLLEEHFEWCLEQEKARLAG